MQAVDELREGLIQIASALNLSIVDPTNVSSILDVIEEELKHITMGQLIRPQPYPNSIPGNFPIYHISFISMNFLFIFCFYNLHPNN